MDNSNSDNSKSPLIRSSFCSIGLDFLYRDISKFSKETDNRRTVSDHSLTKLLSSEYLLGLFIDSSQFVYIMACVARRSSQSRREKRVDEQSEPGGEWGGEKEKERLP